jgi:hypothetical protein
MAAEAQALGHGAVRAADQAAAVSETTVRKGVFELEAGEKPLGGCVVLAGAVNESWI